MEPSLRYSTFQKSLSGENENFNKPLPGGDNKPVKYIDKPDYHGFQKRKKFTSQQEYRYIFPLKHLRDTVKNLDFISDRFIFKAKVMPSCFTFKITDL